MSNIIKSRAVVDRRENADLHFLVHHFDTDPATPVIKRDVLTGNQPPAVRRPPDRDALLEELNTVRIDIEDARQELGSLLRRMRETESEIRKLEERKAELDEMEGMSFDEQARVIIRDAQTQAENMISLAKKQAGEAVEQLRAQGYLDGLEQGASEAHEKYSAEHEPDIHRLEALMTELSRIRDDMIRESENEIVELIITVAEKVVGRTLREDPKAVIDMLREVMEQNHREEYVKVMISADLMPAEAKVSDNISKTIQQLGRQVEVVVDATALPGTMHVETEGGITDLSVKTQMDNIRAMLLDPCSNIPLPEGEFAVGTQLCSTGYPRNTQ